MTGERHFYSSPYVQERGGKSNHGQVWLERGPGIGPGRAGAVHMPPGREDGQTGWKNYQPGRGEGEEYEV